MSAPRLIVGLSIVVLVVGFMPVTQADQYDNQINALNQQNAQAQAEANKYRAQAATYQGAIDQLQSEINAVQSALTANQAKQADLQKQIAAAEAKLALEKQYLANDLKTMYVNGDMTTIEMLATSGSLSDYVDQQEYRLAVQDKLQTTLDTINKLKAQLSSEKKQVDELVAAEQRQKSELATAQAKQAQMLAYSEQQKSQYEAQIRANNAQIANLEAEQQAALAALAASSGGNTSYGSYGTFEFRNLTPEYSCGGGYDYCWAGFDQYVSDTWGLGLARECVHYAADRAARGLNLAPYLSAGRGNAEDWPSSLGGVYPVNHNPSGGHVVAVVAWPGGGGHAMYVERVLSGGWVHVSQMNWDVQGHYSEMDVKDSGVLFVHFP